MKRRKKRYGTLLVLPMYLFTLGFVVGPLVYMVALSFMTKGESFSAEHIFTLQNYAKIFNPTYLATFGESFQLALLSTGAVILLGYPFGLCIAMTKKPVQRFFLTAQMVPYWVNSLIRLYGWIIIFRANGLLDKLLMGLGVTKEPLRLLYTYPMVVVGMIYVLLPFMVTSVYAVAEKLDFSLIEASRDLGAGRFSAFRTVILPMTLPGLLTGITLTFIPSMGLFFIASILGGNKVVLVGSVIEEQLMRIHNEPFAAALSVVLTLLTVLIIGLTRIRRRGETKRRENRQKGRISNKI